MRDYTFQDRWTLNPLCRVIVGFKNFTRHATRSQYVSFAIDEQPQMCELLLLISHKKLVSEKISMFPSKLFDQLIDYGFMKPLKEISFFQRIKGFFNFLNENRFNKIKYNDTVYAITSFVFMAFYSHKNGEFIKEKAILPYWCRKKSRITFKLLNKESNVNGMLNISKNTLDKLIKYGLFDSIEKVSNIYDFFKNNCVLSNDLLKEMPDFYQNQMPYMSEGKSKYILNQHLYLTSEDIPDEFRSGISNFAWFISRQPSIWVFNPVREILSVYWLTEKQKQYINDLKIGTIKPENIDDETFALFVSSYILQDNDVIEKMKTNWSSMLAEMRFNMKDNYSLLFNSILLPLDLAITRRYIRFLLDNKLLIPDKANGKTKNRFWVHRDEFTFYLQAQASTILNRVLSKPIKPGHNALTVYTPGATLPKHQDDVLAFSWVFSLAIETSPEQKRAAAWPICFEDPKNKVHSAMLQAGDGILINPQMPHWRDELQGHALNILFMWFVEQNFSGYVNGSWID